MLGSEPLRDEAEASWRAVVLDYHPTRIPDAGRIAMVYVAAAQDRVSMVRQAMPAYVCEGIGR